MSGQAGSSSMALETSVNCSRPCHAAIRLTLDLSDKFLYMNFHTMKPQCKHIVVNLTNCYKIKKHLSEVQLSSHELSTTVPLFTASTLHYVVSHPLHPALVKR